MAETLAIPAGVLDVLGGLPQGAPPALAVSFGQLRNTSNVPNAALGGRTVFAAGSGDLWPRWDEGHAAKLLLPESAYAVAYVLARHVGLDPSQGVTWRYGPFGPVGMSHRPETFRVTGLIYTRHFCSSEPPGGNACIVPTLTPDMTPLRMLAEVAVWEARVARLHQKQGLDDDETWRSYSDSDDLPTAMSETEQVMKLETWTVEPS